MKSILILLGIVLSLISCDSKPSLQKYLVDKEDKKEFITASLSGNLIFQNLDSLSVQGKSSLDKIEKINVLALTKSKGDSIMESERTMLSSILQTGNYKALMNVNSAGRQVNFVFSGEEDAIDELIFFGYDSDMGMLLLRMRGDQIGANDLFEYTKIAQNMDAENISDLSGFIPNSKLQ